MSPPIVLAAGGQGIVVSSKQGRLFIEQEDVGENGVISAAVHVKENGEGALVGAALMSKQVVIYCSMDIGGCSHSKWTKVATHELPKRLSSLCFDRCGESIIVADTTGDVYRLPLTENIFVCVQEEKRVEKHLLLGHFSLLTDVSVMNGMIATADRDNKIRVSRFPQSFIIESFCLGHTDFVTCVRWVSKNTLVSGAGDGTVRIWNTKTGQYSAASLIGSCDGVTVVALDVSKALTGICYALLQEQHAVFLIDARESPRVPIVQKLELEQDSIVTGLAVDSASVLWLSFSASSIIKGFVTVESGKDVFLQHVASLDTDSLHVLRNRDTIANKIVSVHPPFNRSEWLCKLRKKPILSNWKGKKRRAASASI